MIQVAPKELCSVIIIGLVIGVLPVRGLSGPGDRLPISNPEVGPQSRLDSSTVKRPSAGVSANDLKSPAARALEKRVGPQDWQQLLTRLATVNSDIATRGFRSFPGTTDKLLTGYPYNEYYDWDLYFENI